jgi:hypothetical protein
LRSTSRRRLAAAEQVELDAAEVADEDVRLAVGLDVGDVDEVRLGPGARDRDAGP